MHSFHMRRLTGTDIKANVGGRQTASRPNVALKKQTNKKKILPVNSLHQNFSSHYFFLWVTKKT